jgi:hypothetical protein
MTELLFPGALLFAALWELWRPRGPARFPVRPRRVWNLGFWLSNTTLAALIFTAPARLWVMPGWFGLVAGFLVLDLTTYLIHRAYHTPLLWRLHAMHHSDPDVDWSTAVRFHPGEYLLTAAAYWLALRVLGVPVAVGAVHVACMFVLAGATHVNARWPAWAERALAPIIITLDAHLEHHSIDVANVNFGGVFSWWDRLFGTYRRPSHDPVCGVKELDPRDSACSPLAMLATPLRIGKMHTETIPGPDGLEIETSAERRGKLLRLRARLVRNGRVEAVHRADYAHDDASAIIDFTREFEELAHLENLRLFPADIWNRL